MEKVLSSSEEIRELYRKIGVVVFILNSKGQTLLLQEDKANPETGRSVGEFSVLCETSEDDELWQETVVRGLQEELGLRTDQIFDYFELNSEECFLGETLFVDGVLARVILTHYKGPDNLFFSLSGDGEVNVIGWENPENLCAFNLRVGVRKVLSECLEMGLLK